MGYLLWHNYYRDGFCALGALQNVPKDEQILRGTSRAEGFPDDAFYEMSPEFPKDIEVPDNVHTMIHYVVSDKLRRVLAPELGASRVEFLPVKIKNHKGRFAEGEYFVMNPLDVLDAIDIDASGGEYNDLDPTQLCMVTELVLRPLPGDPAMFRPQSWTRLILVREDIVAKLKAAGLTGLAFKKPEDFGG